jgi:peptide methionine sulfoxide reductase msrA/msrB
MIKPLTDDEAFVIIHKGTERPFSGQYRDHHEQGLYCCRQCHSPLYRSTTKFDSHCGRPSFDDAIPGKVLMIPDSDGIRTEIVCRTCKGHLGHVFVGEQWTQTNVRHCVNSVSLVFVEEKNITDTIRAQIPQYASITLGGGCFWCIEGALSQVPGVIECRSGYMGGKRPFPRYEHVCSG